MSSSEPSNQASDYASSVDDDVVYDEYRIFPRLRKAKSYSEDFEEDIGEEENEDIVVQETSGVQKIFSHREVEGMKEYYVKFKYQSYRNCQWVDESTLESSKLLQKYNKKLGKLAPPQPPYFPEEYTQPEKVIGCEEYEGVKYYVVKWNKLDYEDNTFEKEADFLTEYIKDFEKRNIVPTEEELVIPPHPAPNEWKKITEPPVSNTGKVARSYQLEGLNFFTNSWYYGKNVILADEMGLGKTCQASLFLNYLFKTQKIRGPFLILVPYSIIQQWERELADWTNLNVVGFYGSKAKREAIKRYELFYDNTTIPKFNALITTYDFAKRESELFATNFIWESLIIDEAHSLKNFKSKLTKTLHMYNAKYKILLTGTPLQNNTQELWSLLNFLDEKRFADMQAFQEKFGVLSDAEQIKQLQAILHPLMLRRLKGDVEKNLAPLEEVIIECGMTQHQRAYYKSIYTKNMQYLTRGAHSQSKASLNNIFMELRKVCNHPYLINGAEKQILIERKEALLKQDPNHQFPPSFEYESLIRSAGKMILLDKLLAKLKADGHRVLIFSQMTRMIDIISDYLYYRGYKYQKIDGRDQTDARQRAIDSFNAPDSQDFVFILCTKAGGLGINLASADTVVIYDSDWNPQNDLQATARCHRIGQTKNVKVYTFLTTKSYEMKMFESAALKLGLDHAVLEAPKENQKVDDTEKLLRLGAYYAFEGDDESTEQYNEGDIDTILSRSKTIKHESAVGGEGSTFSKAEFKVDEDEVDVSAPDFWQKYMPEEKEDDFYEGGTIADRRRLQRELAGDGDAFEEHKQGFYTVDDDDDDMWSKKKLLALQRAYMLFGWGRWDMISVTFDPRADVSFLKSVCHIFTKVYLDSTEDNEKDPLIKHIYELGIVEENIKAENQFMKAHKDELKSEIARDVPKKINKLILLYYLNEIISGCKNPPEGLLIPTINSPPPAEWWTIDDDKELLYGTWKHGFQSYSSMKFSKEETIMPKYLNKRLKFLVNGIKRIAMKASNSSNAIGISFSSDAFKVVRETWTKTDAKQVQSTLCSYGYPSIERFKEKANISSKTQELVEQYAEALIKYCDEFEELEKEKKEPEMGILVEHLTLGQAQRVKRRVELFKRARESLESPKRSYTENEKRILELFDKYGYDFSEDEEELHGLLGCKDGLEGKLTKKIQQLCKVTSQRGAPAVYSSTLPDYEKDEDGNPKFPIQVSQSLIINSLGVVEYERPDFHNERYIYPIGFESKRLFHSCIDIDERVWYTSKVIDDGGPMPLFRVEIPGTDVCFEGNVPSKPWQMVIKAIEDLKEKEGRPRKKSTSISGPESFGFSNQLVIHLTRDLPNADKCEKYLRPVFKDDDGGDAKAPTPRPRQSRNRRPKKVDYKEFDSTSESEYSTHEEEKKEENDDDEKDDEKDEKDSERPVVSVNPGLSPGAGKGKGFMFGKKPMVAKVESVDNASREESDSFDSRDASSDSDSSDDDSSKFFTL